MGFRYRLEKHLTLAGGLSFNNTFIPHRLDRFLSVHEQLIVAHDLTMSIQIKLLADSNIKL